MTIGMITKAIEDDDNDDDCKTMTVVYKDDNSHEP